MNKMTFLVESYSQGHNHPINKLLHLIGIPCALFSLLLLTSWIHITMPGYFDIPMSWLSCAVLVGYYTRLDKQLALLFCAILLPFIFAANLLATYWLSYPLFCFFFAVGFILQVIGHLIENKYPLIFRQPALLVTFPLLMLHEIMHERGNKASENPETTLLS